MFFPPDWDSLGLSRASWGGSASGLGAFPWVWGGFLPFGVWPCFAVWSCASSGGAGAFWGPVFGGVLAEPRGVGAGISESPVFMPLFSSAPACGGCNPAGGVILRGVALGCVRNNPRCEGGLRERYSFVAGVREESQWCCGDVGLGLLREEDMAPSWGTFYGEVLGGACPF